jgi:hypothetical protein
MIMTS